MMESKRAAAARRAAAGDVLCRGAARLPRQFTWNRITNPARPCAFPEPHWFESLMPREQKLDSTIQIVTPENIAFDYQVAGPFQRVPAFLLDFGIRALFLTTVFIIVLMAGVWGGQLFNFGIFLIVLFVTEWFYGGLFEAYMNGQTPGKRWLGLRVLTTDGQPITGWQAILRNFLRLADTMPWLSVAMLLGVEGVPEWLAWLPLGSFGLACTMLNRRYQRLGDLVSGTMVVVEEHPWSPGLVKLEDPRVDQLAKELPASMQLSRTTTRALAMYTERRRYLSVGRRHEVARHLAEPWLERLGMPDDTSYDLLLCAMYRRTFGVDDDPASVKPKSLSARKPARVSA